MSFGPEFIDAVRYMRAAQKDHDHVEAKRLEKFVDEMLERMARGDYRSPSIHPLFVETERMTMITESEADQLAAGLVLSIIQTLTRERLPDFIKPDDIPATLAALKPIEAWLRRRALGGDKIAIKQTERELGHQVKMRGKP